MNINKNPRLIGSLKSGIYAIVIAVFFFICAGRIDHVIPWIYFIIVAINTVVMSMIMNPDLIKERSSVQKDYKKWDLFPAIIVGRIGPLLIIIISAFDIRFGWTEIIPLYFQVMGLLILVISFLITDAAVITNNFFSGVVRIQKDRGHTVVDRGPYKYVRHPGYAGSILWDIITPIIFGSLWAMIPAAFVIIVTIIRTAMEDRTLQNELDGYLEYSSTVRYRLLPGIW